MFQQKEGECLFHVKLLSPIPNDIPEDDTDLEKWGPFEMLPLFKLEQFFSTNKCPGRFLKWMYSYKTTVFYFQQNVTRERTLVLEEITPCKKVLAIFVDRCKRAPKVHKMDFWQTPKCRCRASPRPISPWTPWTRKNRPRGRYEAGLEQYGQKLNH